jgi:tRNA(fMet)-specific endonuclease VapC
MYLLDTNHLSSILKKDECAYKKLHSSNLNYCSCVIVKGEMMFMANNSQFKENNLKNINALLSELNILDIGKQTAKIYGEIKALLCDKFGPKEKSKRRNFNFNSTGISDNDLWIASIAKEHDLTILTTDADFEKIKEVTTIRLDSWFN